MSTPAPWPCGAAMADHRQRWRQGRRAEAWAVLWLRLKGYRILARNFRVPVGEIDVIAGRGRVLALVEVKARADWATARRRGAAPMAAHRPRRPGSPPPTGAAGRDFRFDGGPPVAPAAPRGRRLRRPIGAGCRW